MNKRFFYVVALLFILSFLICSCVTPADGTAHKQQPVQPTKQETSKRGEKGISEIYGLITRNYYTLVDNKILFDGAIKGMQDLLGDQQLYKKVGADGVYVTFSTGASLKISNSELENKTLGRQNIIRSYRFVVSEARAVEPVIIAHAAIDGMCKNLDPHSSFLTKEQYEELLVETKGSFSGVGIEIAIKDNVLTVVSPLEGTPAHKAGIQAGDRIIKIDRMHTRDITLMEAVRRIRGPVGTRVILTIGREGFDKPLDFIVMRNVIPLVSVKKHLLTPEFGYIRISSFRSKAKDNLSSALEELEDGRELKGLILDLRNNPGGLLSQSVEVSDLFLDSGLIVTAKARTPSQNLEFSATKNSKVRSYPIILLVNEGTASASEIVAGALQDRQKAIILGTRTFGKGSVQTILPLSDGAALRLTTALYYTPSGRSIQARGVYPDIEVALTRSSDNLQKDKKEEGHFLREEDLSGHIAKEGKRPEKDKYRTEEDRRVQLLLKEDNQVQNALELIQRLATVQRYDEWLSSTQLFAAELEQRKEMKVVKGDTLPPKITITSHDALHPIEVTRIHKRIAIEGTAEDQSGIVEVIVDGREAIVDKNGHFRADIYLALGVNEILVEAMDRFENRATLEFIVVRERAEAAQPIVEEEATAGLKGWYKDQYAIVVGIDKYRNPSMDQLQNAVNDARELSKMFRRMGYRVIELYDEKATKRAIINSFSNILRRARGDDSFVFYFAGHGQGFTLENGERVGYIIPHDANVDMINRDIIQYDSEAIPLNSIKKYSKSMKAKHIALLFDSCFSGLAMKRGIAVSKRTDLEYYRDLLSRKAINLLTAGDDQPVSDGTGHSPFTRAILNGISKKGLDVHDRDGFATFNQLAVYVKEKVEKATRRRQRPQFDNLSMEDGDLIFRLK